MKKSALTILQEMYSKTTFGKLQTLEGIIYSNYKEISVLVGTSHEKHINGSFIVEATNKIVECLKNHDSALKFATELAKNLGYKVVPDDLDYNEDIKETEVEKVYITEKNIKDEPVKIIPSFVDTLKNELLQVKDVGGKLKISMPLRYCLGSAVTVYVIKTGDRFTVTDNKDAYTEVFHTNIEYVEYFLKSAVDTVNKLSGLMTYKGEIFITDVSLDDLSEQIINVAQAAVDSVSSAYRTYLNVIQKSSFDVSELLRKDCTDTDKKVPTMDFQKTLQALCDSIESGGSISIHKDDYEGLTLELKVNSEYIKDKWYGKDLNTLLEKIFKQSITREGLMTWE